jgi:hypothetical protein
MSKKPAAVQPAVVAPVVDDPPTSVPLRGVEALGTPTKLTVRYPIQVPGRGLTSETFSTAERRQGVISDHGGYGLRLTEWGVVISEGSRRVLAPWSQVLAVEFE